MDRDDLRAAIQGADWERFSGPEYYHPQEARRSLLLLLAVEDSSAAHEAYNAVLFGIGNNHRGSFYPAAMCAVPLLVRIAASGSFWPRFGALEILTDLMVSFGPEQGYEEFEGHPVDLARALVQAMSEAGLTAADQEPESLIQELRAATDDMSAP